MKLVLPGAPPPGLLNVSKWYGSLQALTDCTTANQKGEVVVVCGPSGSGKRTLIKTVKALDLFHKGDITVDGISISAAKTNLPKLRSRVGRVFQHFELFPHLSVTENLTLAQIKVLGRSTDEAKTRGLKMLDVMVLLAKEGMTMMVVTHKMGYARKVSHRVIFMDAGKIVEDCTKQDFFDNVEQRTPRAKEFLSKILRH